MTVVRLRRAAGVVAMLAFIALLASCASFRPKGRIIAGPSGAIGAAALSNDRAAVLSGTGTTRAVFVIDLKSGSTERSFGVTREASGMAAATPSGPLLISIAGTDKRGGAIGAIEQWSLDGRKLATLPAAGPVMAITQVVDGTAYILVRGNGKARAAVRLTVTAGQLRRTIPLEAGIEGLQQCKIGALHFLVYSLGSPGTIVLRERSSGVELRSDVAARNPTCFDGRPNVFAIQKTSHATRVIALSVPSMLQDSAIAANRDLVALYDTPDHAVLALNATAQTSTLELYPQDAFNVARAGSNGP